MKIGGLGPFAFAKRVWKEFTSDDVGGMAAELSYRYFLALFPFVIFLAALGGFIASTANVSDPTGRIMDAIGGALPSDAQSLVRAQIDGVLESRNGGLLSFGIIAALWAASGAMKALMKSLNRAYDVPETRPFWKSTGLALIMTVAATIGILGSFTLFIATQAFGGDIAEAVGAGSAFELTIQIVRWPVVVVLLMLAVAFLYWAAPNIDIPFKFISPGAVVFTLVWIAATIGFSYYVTNFGSYNATYGTLGGVVVLLTWLYLTNAMLLVGAEINALAAELNEPETQRARREKVTSQASATQQKQAMEPRAEPDPGAREGGDFEGAASEGAPTSGDQGDDGQGRAGSPNPPPRGGGLPRFVLLASALGIAMLGARRLGR